MDKKPEETPTIINISNTQYEIVKIVGQELGWTVSAETNDDWDLCWQDGAVAPDKFSKMQLFQKINHFPGMSTLAKKNNLAENLNLMQKVCPDDYNFFPETWVLPKDLFDLKNNTKFNVLITKPEASCQGKGIVLVNKLEDLPEKCIAQRYLLNPFLIDDLKFDLRIYVLLTGCDPLRIFIHQEGLVRFATEEYKDPRRHLNNQYMHLTNYAINKNNPRYKAEPTEDFLGHKRTLTWLFSYLEAEGHDIKKLWQDICAVIIKTIISGVPYISHLYKSLHPDDPTNSMCFEILGFDIILDNSLKPCLLEVNHSPSFTTDSPLDFRVKKTVITDAINLLDITPQNKAIINNTLKNRLKDRNSLKSKDYKKWREIQRNKWAFNRDSFEQQQRSGFVKIYPSFRQSLARFLDISNQIWRRGVIPRINPEPEEPIRIIMRKTFIIPRVLRKAEELSRKKVQSPVSNNNSLTQIIFKATPAPKRIATKVELKLKKSSKQGGNFVVPKILSYSGEHAPEDNKCFMKWKLVKQNVTIA